MVSTGTVEVSVSPVLYFVERFGETGTGRGEGEAHVGGWRGVPTAFN